MGSIITTLLFRVSSLHVNFHVAFLDLGRELMIEPHTDQKSSDSDDNVEDDCQGEEFDQSIDEASLMVVITELPLEFENDISLKKNVRFLLDFDDFLGVLDGLRRIILLEDYLMITIGRHIILRKLIHVHN